MSDVFGKTSALIRLAEELKADTIADPYNGVDMGFKTEAEAYSYFMERVGLDVYSAKLLNAIQSEATSKILIGFSIGASAVWRLSEKVSSKLIKRAICFYSSQIRNYSELNPKFQIELIFPKSEPHFDVCELQANLSKKQNVKTIKVDYLHGFMNYYSSNYNQVAYQDQVKWLRTIAS